LSTRVCYIRRTDRGDRLLGARLVGPRTDERFDAPAVEEADLERVTQDIAETAQWISQRLSASSSTTLGSLCVDADGGSFAWLTAPGADPAVVAATYAQSALGGEDSPEGMSVEPLAGGGPPVEDGLPAGDKPGGALARWKRASGREGAGRLAVMTMSDSAVRLLLSTLDDLRVEPGRVISIWHAVAEAWDSSGPASALSGGAGGGEKIVAQSGAMAAIVLVDPEGRLVWSWSQEGRLRAGGTIRLARTLGADGGPGLPRVSASDTGRLTAEWLAWAAQLGGVPSRILCIGPELAPDGDPEQLSAAAFGRRLTEGWPGASVDLVVTEDPVGATLRRVAEIQDEGSAPAEGLAGLSHRPGRAHRSLYRWAAVAVMALSAVMVGLTYRAYDASAELRADAAEVARHRQGLMAEHVPQFAGDSFAHQLLADEVEKARRQDVQLPVAHRPKPVLQELERIALILMEADPQVVQIREISLDVGVVFRFWVQDVENANEIIGQIANGIADITTDIVWSPVQPDGPSAQGRSPYRMNGMWRRDGQGGGR
jgi:hypothetical protein